jgi:glutathione synthase/RimK-type ligase-like ATP-grasp enzyme
MKVGIQKDYYNLECDFLLKYFEILKANNIECVWLDINEGSFWEDVKEIDLFIYRWRHFDNDKNIAPTIMPIIENDLGIKVFPDQNTSWHFDDKIKQYYLISNHSFPFTKCWIFWDKIKATEWSETAELPVVFKLKGGAGSTNVIKINDRRSLKNIIKIMFGSGVRSGNIPLKDSTRKKDLTINKYLRSIARKLVNYFHGIDSTPFWQIDKNYVLFQKFLSDNTFDTRITVIGNRAFGFRRMTRDDDFRASGSGKIDYDTSKIDLRCVKIAFEISDRLKFQSMAYDFLYNEKKEPEICEICYTFQDRAVYNCPGYWDSDLKWHEGHFWPQYCQLSDLIGSDIIKQTVK